MPPFATTPERGSYGRRPSLERALAQNETRLSVLAQPGHPLTADRLRGRIPLAAEIVAEAETTGIDWPTRETAVPLHLEARSREFFVSNATKADAHFALEASHGRYAGRGIRGFNNFSAILRSQPYKPAGRQDFQRAMNADPSAALYGSKPYLLRAYLVAPEFMSALQAAVKNTGGSSEWNDAIVRGGLEPDEYPEDARLLRASRLAYGLLGNLMRTDDLRRQSEWLGFGSTQQLINNFETELWT
jgi:hypothetical protein